MDTSNWRYWMSLMAVGATLSCGPGTGNEPVDPDGQPSPTLGQSSFVSADGRNGDASKANEEGGNNANNADFAADDEADNSRVAEEGDIYRVSQTDGLILNLNAYRGLQIIDFSDPADPEIIGRAQVSGTPVEMYQVDNRVYILMNNWWGYYGSRTNISTQQYHGGLVAVVDISDVNNPKITSRAQVPGWIRTSRLTRGGGDESLYVVANDWSTDQTYVKSFSVDANGDLAAKSQIDLSGYVQDIQATGDRLIVSRWDWSQQRQGSEISVIDISNPNGTMREGDSVRVQGYVGKKSDMSIQGDVLRVVSGNTWRTAGNTNYVETYDASDISNLTKIDEETFGDGEQLFATIFLEDSAFFVTYEQVDPFHSFSISDTGQLVEESEFIVSGFNSWFKPVSAETRLIGIGINDANTSRAPAVSLYDITDLTNPNPLLDRDELPLDWGWSEAMWDDRAFSVLEKGANVLAPTGELETGLVLLPFNGWDATSQTYQSGVQIFTFSDTTVTKRGMMMHDTPVRRTFVADREEDLTGNMSEMELSLYDTSDVDAPSEVSRTTLAPNYNNLIIFGNYGARRFDRSGYWNWWGHNGTVSQSDSVQIFDLADDPDASDPLAEISVPAHSVLHQVGDHLAVITSDFVKWNDATQRGEYLTSIGMWDLSLPTMPVFKGATTSSDLPPVSVYYDYWGEDCFDCSYYYYYGNQDVVKVVGEALVFSEYEQQSEFVGHEYVTNYWPNNQRWDDCYDENYNPTACTYLEGYRTCSYVEQSGGGRTPEVCQGEFFACTQDDSGDVDCQPTTLDDSELEINSWDHELHRYWSQENFHVVDVSDPASPTVVATVLNGADEESVSTLARGDKLHFTYRQPHVVQGDSRPYVKYYFRTFDFADPANVSRASDVNIPGELVEIDGDTLFTRDFLWGQNIIETSINRLELSNGAAYLRGIKRFEDEIVERVMLDGAGQVVVTHETAWYVNYQEHGYDWEDYDRVVRMSILKTTGSFDTLSEFDVDNWATLQATIAGRALFQVPGGMLIVNTSNTSQPFAQAFFPLRGWAQQFTVEGDEAYVAAGLFGLYKFDLDTFNLLTLP